MVDRRSRSRPAVPSPEQRELRVELYAPIHHPGESPRHRPGARRQPPGAPAIGGLSYGNPFEIKTHQARRRVRGSASMRFRHARVQFRPALSERRFRLVDGETLRVTPPPNGNIAPPGYYLVWIIDNATPPRPCVEGKFIFLSNRRCALFMDRTSFSKGEVDAVQAAATPTSPAEFSSAFYVHLYGFSPAEAGVTDLGRTPASLATFAPAISLTLPPASRTSLRSRRSSIAEDPRGTLNRPQRLIFKYKLNVANATVAATASGSVAVDRYTASRWRASRICTAAAGRSSSRVVRFPSFWMEAFPGSAPTSEYSGCARASSSIREPAAAADPAGRRGQHLHSEGDHRLQRSSANAQGGLHPFNDLSEDPEQSQLQLASAERGTPVYNFAVARVRYRAFDRAGQRCARVLPRLRLDGDRTGVQHGHGLP